MEVISEFTIVDLVILASVLGGILVGFQQGLLRYVLNGVVVLGGFVLSSQLKGPIATFLSGFWLAGTPEQRELWVFAALLVGSIVGGWFVVRAAYRRTRLPIVRQLDELGGAVAGGLWVVIVYSFGAVALDSFFTTASAGDIASTVGFGSLYEQLNQSFLIGWFRDTVIPVAGFLVRPFVPPEIAALLLPGP